MFSKENICIKILSRLTSRTSDFLNATPGIKLRKKCRRILTMALSKERKAEIVKKYGKNEKDTGSAEVQIALLTEQIKALTEHLKKNHKDAASKRGLMILVGQRRSLLNYLAKTDRDAYVKLIVSLGIRK